MGKPKITGYGAGGRADTPARSAKQLTKRNRRRQDPRVVAAAEETRKAQEELDRLMAMDQQGPAAGAFLAAARQDVENAQARQHEAEVQASHDARWSEEVEASKQPALPATGKGGKGWTKGQARSMLMQGYPLRAVIERTGFGLDTFDDIPLIEEIWGVSRAEWLEAEEKRIAKLERQNGSISR